MKKTILGLDIGTNSIGWALVNNSFENKLGDIVDLGSRIIPMSQDVLGKFDSGVSISQTAERTVYRGVRRLNQRNLLRRERLHRALNCLNFLPPHYQEAIDFDKKLGQFINGAEVKLNYRQNKSGEFEFIFKESFQEMVQDFQKEQPHLFHTKKNGEVAKIPYDWTIYYLRKKALSEKISKEELAWIILNFNQKRGYYQLRGEEETDVSKIEEYHALKVTAVSKDADAKATDLWYNVVLENGWIYRRKSKISLDDWIGTTKEFIVTTSLDKDSNLATNKEGEIKRNFRAVDSEKDWIAIKSKTENDIKNSSKEVGEYIYESILAQPKQKIRGKLIRTIERKLYKKELQKILATQAKFHSEFQDKKLYTKCIEELYPRNEAHRNNIKDKDLIYLLLSDIIFYQRPLKSKKSSIANCQYEVRHYKTANGETQEQPLKGIAKSNPHFQEFRLLQFIQNLKIYQKENGQDKDVTELMLTELSDWEQLYEELSTRKEIDQSQLLQYFVKKKLIPKAEKEEYRWNYVEDKKYPMGDMRYQILSRLKKIDNLKVEDFFTNEIEYNLWHIIYSVKDKKEYEQALATFAKKNKLDTESFVNQFKNYPPFKSDYGAYSEKAIKKMLPLMRFGNYWTADKIHAQTKKRIEKLLNAEYDENINDRVREKVASFESIADYTFLPTWLAGYVVYGRHSENKAISQWRSPKDIDEFLKEFKQHSLRNPIVEQVLTETLRVVKDIWTYHGKGKVNFFDEIHLELGREMKNPKDKRERMSKQNAINEKTNQRIKELLEELKKDSSIDGEIRPYSPSQQEILKLYEEGVYQSQLKVDDEIEKIRNSASPTSKEIQRYKLWLDQKYVSPYTGESIPLSQLFTSSYQIEHIIPQSRYFDNSMGNKVICESIINEEKSNATAYEFIDQRGGERIDLGHGKSVRLFSKEQYIEHCNKQFAKNRIKLRNLLAEEIPEGFIQRQMNDTRYISKFAKSLLGNIVREDNEPEATPKKLIPINGAITSRLKKDWGLNDKWNELIAPRFKRMNEITNSNDYGYWDKTINAFRTQVPDTARANFNKKRIDHRHHALDALVLACCDRRHIQYLTSLNNDTVKYNLQPALLIKNGDGPYSKHFKPPWQNFQTDALKALQEIIISFKQNQRVINKTNNKTWQWQKENGQLKKKMVKQTKGENWAIRKPLHKETVYGKVELLRDGKIINATAGRVALSEKFTRKHLNSITDTGIQKILNNHVKNYVDEKGKEQFALAFNPEGIIALNENIVALNNGKFHQPIYKVRIYEVGKKFAVGHTRNKTKKYVEAAKGTNLYFAIYTGKNKKGENVRQYDTIPLNEVIERLKQGDSPVPKQYYDKQKCVYELLFWLSPNDLVYVPSAEDLENKNQTASHELDVEQINNIYKMVSCTGRECHFIQMHIAGLIKNYDSKTKRGELGSINKLEKSLDGLIIKDVCNKIQTDRLGNILKIMT